MKVLFINSVCGKGSTGKICVSLAEKMEAAGHICKIAYGREDNVPVSAKRFAIRIGNKFDVKLHAISTRIFDNHGFASKRATKKFLKWAEDFDPDLIWLHNLHGYYINVEMLFNWLKSRNRGEVKWTLHDCWAFTGHCTHFNMVGCEQWKAQCLRCIQKTQYPSSYFVDACKRNYEKKKRIFSRVNHMMLITPSQWLADLVKKSYLCEYPITVMNNEIDTNVFKYTENDFRTVNNLKEKKIILGVADIWDAKKGLNDFIALADLLNSETVIVLVGFASEREISKLPSSIIGITRTVNQQELAGLYSMADIFFNPTYEDTYPTVNLEAEACGTRVITYRTGGAPETINRNDSVIIDVGAYEEVLKYV